MRCVDRKIPSLTGPSVVDVVAYKSQIGIGKNFSFLKDPSFVNAILLKKAQKDSGSWHYASIFTSHLALIGMIHTPVY
jgi:hypothetical protein